MIYMYSYDALLAVYYVPSAKFDIYWLCAICKAKCVITHMLVVKLQFLLSLREIGDNVLFVLLLFPICVACNAVSSWSK